MLKWLTAFVGSRNQRLLRRYGEIVAAVNELEPGMKALSEAALRSKTSEFRQRLAGGARLDDLIPEACAVVREAARRTIGMRHFDVQLIGALVLHDGRIAEMRTGEGKTLVATVAAYLNALPGKGVHIVTVNEYLARRDAEWMAPVYRFLGLEVGVILGGQSIAEKQAAYAADVSYATNSELGFDYLRDNLSLRTEDQVQRPLAYAVVDEVDSILIDEARTPLVIGAPSTEGTGLYVGIDRLIPRLTRQPRLPKENDDGGPGDFAVDEKTKRVYLSEAGHQNVEKLMVSEGLLPRGESLYDPRNARFMYHLMAALRAHALYRRDVDYIVRDGEVMIVDPFTGRALTGRRWFEGLHQAVEAKERVPIREESHTAASVTFQNFFRLYGKLAGMTGTADTEAYEFEQVYRLEVVVIPTHRPMIRRDETDLVYLTTQDKFRAIIADVKDCVQRGQPVLVGTTSIETSEHLSGLLADEDVPHQVLNAKQHEREARIVAEAGRPGMVTIATNMAGRGTDIVLGGNLGAELAKLGPEASEAERQSQIEKWRARNAQVVAAGGLRIIGTERHESRRIDNQLRGRSGRQGDPGSSRFYTSFEDNLMRVFGDEDRIKGLLRSVGVTAGQALESKLLNRQVQRAQRRVEEQNFDMRKGLLWYDDIANEQRKIVYDQRNQLMRIEDVTDALVDIRAEVSNFHVNRFAPPESMADAWDLAGLLRHLQERLEVTMTMEDLAGSDPILSRDKLSARVFAAIQDQYRNKIAAIPPEDARRMERQAMLRILDDNWREHLAEMDYLQKGIHLRGLGQRNPRDEYKREAFEMFGQMMDRVKRQLVRHLAISRVRSPEEVAAERETLRLAEEERLRAADFLQPRNGPISAGMAAGPRGRVRVREYVAVAGPTLAVDSSVGRNEPCPCGSGKKYRTCHGQLK